MRLAIPVWDGRISPVFDSAGQLLVVDLENGRERSRNWETMAESNPCRRARRLADLKVNVLICGGISRSLAALLGTSGIMVVPWRAGPAEEVLDAYVKGGLLDPRWAMPGYGGRQRRMRAGFGRAEVDVEGAPAEPVPPRRRRKER